MSPWFAMPAGHEALRQAAFARVQASLSAAECAARLLAAVPADERAGQLVAVLREQLRQAEEALERLS